MGINTKTILYVILLTVLALVSALHATRTFNTAVYNGQKYTAPTTTTPKSNNVIGNGAAASRRYHPPAPAANNVNTRLPQRPLYKPPTTTPEPKKCKCNCEMGWKPVCAKDYGVNDMDTFPTKCALDCYNCTHNKRYVVISNTECTS